MEKNYDRFLAGQMGESLVVAELGRRGIVATSFSGNLPNADIVAFYKGRNIHVQVKAMRKISTHLDAKSLLRIEFTGATQTISGLVELQDGGLIFIFVKLGESAGQDKFFILTHGDLQEMIYKGYQSYLDSKGGVRPRNPASTHSSITEEALTGYKDNWKLIKNRLGMPLEQT